MPKQPKFQVTNTSHGWKVNVPKSISDTGKKQELFFPSREKALEKAQELRKGYRSHGEKASVLPPRVASDALRAWQLLEPLGITLEQAARELVGKRKAEEQSVKISFAAEKWIEAKSQHRSSTITSYKLTIGLLTSTLGERQMASVDGPEISDALKGLSYSMHRRNARAFWGWAAKSPRKWCKVEVFDDVEEAPSMMTDKDISVLAPAEARKILECAEKHYPESVPLFAVAFFAGVRMEEISKLDETAFSVDGIELGPAIAKKRRRRFIPMNPTLKAWLDAYPFAACPNWEEKQKAVRALAGWDVQARILPKQPKPTRGKWLKNAIRHTHASAEITNGATLEDLLFRFGHTDGPTVLRSHYVGRYSKRQAYEYIRIGPHRTSLLLATA